MDISEDRFRAMLESMNDLFWETDTLGRYTYLSPNSEQLFGCKPDELVGRTPFDLMPPEEADRVRLLFEPFLVERRPFSLLAHAVLRKDGTQRVIECSGRPVFDDTGRFLGYRGVDRDITDRKRLEDELRQAEKMASVGLLLGGVAHELNNPLMGILGLAQLLLADLSQENPMREDIATIEKEAKRCKRLIKSLLAFARRHEHQFQQADLNALVQEIVELKSPDLRRAGIGLDLDLAPDLAPVRVDPHQVQQVLLNLLNNAEQAIDQSKGRIKVETRHAGGEVTLTVSDSGPGIPSTVLPRIFEPFFTTKEPGKGTGLGLSICTEIAKEHGGSLSAESPPGAGARFTLRLPVSIPTSPSPYPLPKGEGVPGRRTTLVLDDDELVLKFMCRALRQEGWDVEAHSVVFDALAAIKARDFDLVISDFHMPGMNGGEFYRRAVESRPETADRFIMVTGSQFLEEARSFTGPAGVPVLLKPFDLEEFHRVLGLTRARGGKVESA